MEAALEYVRLTRDLHAGPTWSNIMVAAAPGLVGPSLAFRWNAEQQVGAVGPRVWGLGLGVANRHPVPHCSNCFLTVRERVQSVAGSTAAVYEAIKSAGCRSSSQTLHFSLTSYDNVLFATLCRSVPAPGTLLRCHALFVAPFFPKFQFKVRQGTVRPGKFKVRQGKVR